MNTDQLHDVLVRAAEPVPRPDLARTALASARRTRRRQQGWGAGVACAVAVVVTVVGVRVTSNPVVELPPTAPTTDAAPTTDPTPPSIEESVIQPRWDPATVADLPPVDVGLPASLDPPAEAGPPDGWDSAVAVVQEDGWVGLVDSRGEWSRLDLPEKGVDRYCSCTMLTTDGSRVVFTGRSALWVFTFAGDWQRLAYPDDFTTVPDWGTAEMVPDGEDALWISDRRDSVSWHVDLASGSWDDFDEALEIAAASSDGTLIRFGWRQRSRFLSVGDLGDETARWNTSSLFSLTHPSTDDQSVAAVRGVSQWSGSRQGTELDGLLALRLDDLSTRAYLPFPAPAYTYTDGGGMQTLAWIDAATVLARVTPGVEGSIEQYLFTWDVETGELRLASSLPVDVELSIALTPSG